MLPPTAHCPCAATKSSLWFGYLRAGGGAPRIGVRLGWYGSRDQVIAADGQPGGHRIQHYTADLPDAWVRCCCGLHATLPCHALPCPTCLVFSSLGGSVGPASLPALLRSGLAEIDMRPCLLLVRWRFVAISATATTSAGAAAERAGLVCRRGWCAAAAAAPPRGRSTPAAAAAAVAARRRRRRPRPRPPRDEAMVGVAQNRWGRWGGGARAEKAGGPGRPGVRRQAAPRQAGEAGSFGQAHEGKQRCV